MTPLQLHNWRIDRGLSQEAAARLFGVSPRQYAYWEAGVTSRGTPRPAIPEIAVLAWETIERRLSG